MIPFAEGMRQNWTLRPTRVTSCGFAPKTASDNASGDSYPDVSLHLLSMARSETNHRKPGTPNCGRVRMKWPSQITAGLGPDTKRFRATR